MSPNVSLIVMSNVTYNRTASFTVKTPKNQTLVGDSAEWIVEKQEPSDSVLGNYGTVFINRAYAAATGATRGKTSFIGPADGTPVAIIDSHGNVISAPTMYRAIDGSDQGVWCEYTGAGSLPI
jgi:hypothetical protein